MWLDIAAVDTMLQRAGLHLTLHCTQFDLHKQMASDKRHLIEAAGNKTLAAAGSKTLAAAAGSKTLVAAAAAAGNKMKDCD